MASPVVIDFQVFKIFKDIFLQSLKAMENEPESTRAGCIHNKDLMLYGLNRVTPWKRRTVLRSDLLLWSRAWDGGLQMQIPHKSGLDPLPQLMRLA